MIERSLTAAQQAPRSSNFDLFRLTKSKETVDLSPNTLRSWNKLGLAFYKKGRIVFVSQSELHLFIRSRFSAHGGGK